MGQVWYTYVSVSYTHLIWTYSLEDIWKGLKDCYADLAADVKKQYGLTLKKVGAMGVSAMMHGYMAFDADGKLLVPFRTWRNTVSYTHLVPRQQRL